MPHGRRRVRTALLAALLLLAALPAAADVRDVDDTCAGAAPGVFTDVGGTFGETVDCVGWLGVAEGFADGTFRPGVVNTRGQLAAFLARTYELLDAPEPAPGAGYDPFDDEGAVFAAEIARLAALGVVDTDDRRFGTAQPIDRGTLARWVVRLLDVAPDGVVDGPDPAPDAFPDDDGHPDEPWIDAAAAAGVVGGFTDGRYRPDGGVTRGQMSAYVARVVDVLATDDLLTLPPPAPRPTPLPSEPAPQPPPPADGLLPPDTTYALPPAPPAPPSSSAYRRYANEPAWDPCATIHVATNLAGLPASASADLDDALAAVSRYSGLRFLRVGDVPFRAETLGDTGGLPLAGFEGRQVLLVTGARRAPGGGELGRASISYRIGPGGVATITSARIALSPDTGASILPAILRHELGHAVGLDHVDDDRQLLYPVLSSRGPRDFAAGDVAGLHQVGSAVQGCRR